ncbi:hypothetical protein JTE90_010979 [Oedothorax gibbosus]|uniref:Uncharacterized protein n=1 Tax=Oedothorax gibbosus TaxID=931172 RepID=A0AAV6TGN9_9ARAC|nr:hypothetical protein JTE90_026853 [Oedothorax gibbosus]KAG8171237.1 hypothetical protein JTE90_010979 [Oedothorax gibbosus]
MGLAPTLGNSPGQGDLLQSPSPARSLLNATFPHALASGDSALGFSRRFSTHHVPRCILQRGEETTRVEKDDKRVELATRTAFNSHPPAARCYDHNMHHIPTEIISAMERHGTGAGPLAEKLRREGSRPD